MLVNGDEVQIGKFRWCSDRTQARRDDGVSARERPIAPRWPGCHGPRPATTGFSYVTISVSDSGAEGLVTPPRAYRVGGSPHTTAHGCDLITAQRDHYLPLKATGPATAQPDGELPPFGSPYIALYRDFAP